MWVEHARLHALYSPPLTSLKYKKSVLFINHFICLHSNSIPFPVTPPQSPHPIHSLPAPLCLYEGAPPPTHPSCLIPLASSFAGASSLPPLPLISDKATDLSGVLAPSMCTLLVGITPGSSGWSSWLILLWLENSSVLKCLYINTLHALLSSRSL